MKKINAQELWTITTALELLNKEMKKEIDLVESKGKRPLYTKEYVDQLTSQAQETVNNLSLRKAIKAVGSRHLKH